METGQQLKQGVRVDFPGDNVALDVMILGHTPAKNVALEWGPEETLKTQRTHSEITGQRPRGLSEDWLRDSSKNRLTYPIYHSY